MKVNVESWYQILCVKRSLSDDQKEILVDITQKLLASGNDNGNFFENIIDSRKH